MRMALLYPMMDLKAHELQEVKLRWVFFFKILHHQFTECGLFSKILVLVLTEDESEKELLHR
jgi:hypothetical protein